MKAVLNMRLACLSVLLLICSTISCPDSTDGGSSDVDDSGSTMDSAFEVPIQDVVDTAEDTAIEDPTPEVAEEPEVGPDLVEVVDEPVEDVVLDTMADIYDEIVEEIICPPEEALELVFEEEGCLTISPETAVGFAQTNIRSLLIGGAQSLVFLDDSSFMLQFEDMTGMGDCPGYDDEDYDPDCVDGIDYGALEGSVDEGITDFIEQHIVTDNVEEEEDCRIVLRIPSVDLCDEPGEGDPPCVFETVPLRIALWSPEGGNIYGEVLLGDARINIADVRAFANQLSIITDLEALRDGLVEVALASEESIDLPETMEGVVELDLSRDDGEYHLSTSVREPMTFEWTLASEFPDADDAVPATLQWEQSCPFLDLSAYPDSREMGFSMDFTALGFSLPNELVNHHEECCPDGAECYSCCEDDSGYHYACDYPFDGSIDVAAANLSFSSLLVDDDDTLIITDFDFGDELAGWSNGEDPVILAELNPDADDRAFSLEIRAEQGYWNIETPSSELVAHGIFTLENLPAFMDEPEGFLNEELIAILEYPSEPGPDPDPLAIRFHWDDDLEPFEVFTGVLTIASLDDDGEMIEELTAVIEEGECILMAEGEEGDHFLKNMYGGDCEPPPE